MTDTNKVINDLKERIKEKIDESHVFVDNHFDNGSESALMLTGYNDGYQECLRDIAKFIDDGNKGDL